ncbi:MAG TPA: M17 family peptidase N-terminal domain-containing protein, partial [Vicinamibacterales bacterium]
MHTVHKSPRVFVSQRTPLDGDADLLIVPVFENDDLADQPALARATGGDVEAARARLEFRGHLYDVYQTHAANASGQVCRVLMVGAGPRADLTEDRLRRIAATAGLAARQRRAVRLIVVHRAVAAIPEGRAAEVLTEGFTLANFEGASFKSSPEVSWLASVELCFAGEARDLAAHVARGVTMGECS